MMALLISCHGNASLTLMGYGHGNASLTLIGYGHFLMCFRKEAKHIGSLTNSIRSKGILMCGVFNRHLFTSQFLF